MLCIKLEQAGLSFGQPELGTIAGLGKEQEAVLFHMGTYDVYVKADPKNIEIAKVYSKNTKMGKNLAKELLAATVTDAQSLGIAEADRAVEELFDVVQQIIENGSGTSKVVAADSAEGGVTSLYMKQKIFSIRDQYSIYDMDQQPVYEVQGNLTGLSFEIRGAAGESIYTIKKKIVSITPEYTIFRGKDKVGVIKKKIKLTKPEIGGEVDGQPVTISGDMSGYHFSIDLGGKTVGSVDTVRLTWGDCYEIKSRMPEKQDAIVMIAIICDNSLKGKS